MASRFLYLVRHGEAAGEDGSLTAAGQEQARLAGARLAAVPLAAIAHSPRPRAAQTARLIAGHRPGVRSPNRPCWVTTSPAIRTRPRCRPRSPSWWVATRSQNVMKVRRSPGRPSSSSPGRGTRAGQ
jgi:probable phosphoglycerate mutase